jgi:hypothetical protein
MHDRQHSGSDAKQLVAATELIVAPTSNRHDSMPSNELGHRLARIYSAALARAFVANESESEGASRQATLGVMTEKAHLMAESDEQRGSDEKSVK